MLLKILTYGSLRMPFFFSLLHKWLRRHTSKYEKCLINLKIWAHIWRFEDMKIAEIKLHQYSFSYNLLVIKDMNSSEIIRNTNKMKSSFQNTSRLLSTLVTDTKLQDEELSKRSLSSSNGSYPCIQEFMDFAKCIEKTRNSSCCIVQYTLFRTCITNLKWSVMHLKW